MYFQLLATSRFPISLISVPEISVVFLFRNSCFLLKASILYLEIIPFVFSSNTDVRIAAVGYSSRIMYRYKQRQLEAYLGMLVALESLEEILVYAVNHFLQIMQ
jgi:hypothetical protein